MRRGVLCGVVLAALAFACTASPTSEEAVPTGTSAPSGVTSTSAPSRNNARVTRVVDGDTIEVVHEGVELTVRLIGIDTPESVAPGEPVECFALEASAYATERLEGESVRLEFDVEQIDPFGRTLAYVWRGNELFNETLVREGYAFVTTFPPNVRYVDRFRAAQSEARSDGRGMWDSCPGLIRTSI